MPENFLSWEKNVLGIGRNNQLYYIAPLGQIHTDFFQHTGFSTLGRAVFDGLVTWSSSWGETLVEYRSKMPGKVDSDP